MNKLNRILLGALVVQVILILLFQLRGDDTSLGKLQPIAAGLDKDKVERIRIFDRTAKGEDEPADADKTKGKLGENAAVDLVKKGTTWNLASHFDYPADPEKITDLVGKIEGLRTRGAIASGKARQRQLEVADDYYQRKVVLTSAGGSETTLFVGASAGSRQTSVRVAGHDDIHGVTGLTAFGVGARASSWVNSAYLDLDAERVTSVDLVNANGTFHFERTGTEPNAEWKITVDGQPLVPAAGMELNKMEVEKVPSRTAKIYLTEPADPKRAVDKPAATITLHLKAAAKPADASATPESKLEDAAQDHVLEVATTDQKDRYYVREKGRPAAALVDQVALLDLVQLTRDKLVAKAGESLKPPDPGPGEGMPEGLPEGLPPGFDPSQLGGGHP